MSSNIEAFDWKGNQLFSTALKECHGIFGMSVNNSYLIVSGENNVAFIRLKDGEKKVFNLNINVTAICADDRWMALRTADKVHIWRLSNGMLSTEEDKIYEHSQHFFTIKKIGQNAIAAPYKGGIKLIFITETDVQTKDFPIQNMNKTNLLMPKVHAYVHKNLIYLKLDSSRFLQLTFE